jgi:hypothetical protein
MYCSKCGNLLNSDQKFCARCGNLVQNENPSPQNRFIFNSDLPTSEPTIEVKPIISNEPLVDNRPIINSEVSNNNINIPNVPIQNNVNNYQPIYNEPASNNNAQIVFGVICVFFFIVLTVFIFRNSSDVYVGGADSDQGSDGAVVVSKSKYRTSIVYNNFYDSIKIRNFDHSIELIEKDSLNEKKKCSKEGIDEIEDRIVNNYGITAVNLCELDLDLALELEDVVKTIYYDYPSARGYLTNFTLVNADKGENYIAFFAPILRFATADTYNGYPNVFKTVVGLNSAYHLNIPKLEGSIKNASDSGHFPKNSNRISPMAHELAHYLSFVAMMGQNSIDSVTYITRDNEPGVYDLLVQFSSGEFSHKMIKEAHQNYMTKYNSSISELEFRSSISGYAVTKDKEGNYIYDETIAEAFSDWYTNKEQAAKASIEVVNVLKKYVGAVR